MAVAVYVGLGGLRSAIFNEVMQFVLIWGGALLVPILGLVQAGGWTSLKAKILTNLGSDTYFHVWRDTGSFAANPMGVHWTGIVFGLGFVISFGYWTTDFLVVQRVLAAHNLRAARMAPIIASFFKMAVPFIVILPGLLGLVLLQNPDGSRRMLVGADVVAACSQASGGGLENSSACSTSMAKTNLPADYQQKVLSGAPDTELHDYNQALPLMMVRYMGPGLLGLGITALIAGFMSGMAGNVSAFSTVWTYDIYRPLIHKNTVLTAITFCVGRLLHPYRRSRLHRRSLSRPAVPRHHGLRSGALQHLRCAAAGRHSLRHVLETRHPHGRFPRPLPRNSVFRRPLYLGQVQPRGAGRGCPHPMPSRWPKMFSVHCGHFSLHRLS